MKLSVAIMAHPKREAFVEELLPQLPGATVVWDRRNDRWDTGRRSMEAHDPEANYHLVVQDDALLCPNFLRGVELALCSIDPSSPAAFYTGKTRPFARAVEQAVQAATAAGQSWFTAQGPLWGPAVAMPVHRIDEVLEGADPVPISNYDTKMATYLQSVGTDCWYSIPSLVDHRVGDENPSLVPGRSAVPSRTAHRWIGTGDPTEVDWSTGAHETGGLRDYESEEYAAALEPAGIRLRIE